MESNITATQEKKINDFILAIRQVCGKKALSLHEPLFTGNEVDYLKDCIKSNYVSSIGDYVVKFERMLSEYTGAKNVIATINGTSALHLAIYCSGISANDEILLPSLTFVGTANAIRYAGAIPHFCDVSKKDLNIDFELLDDYLRLITESHSGFCTNKLTKRRIFGIIPVHLYGQPIHVNKLLRLASKYNLVIVEDAAESLGSFYNSQHTGTAGLAGCLSFNGNKIITTGGGGAVLTNNNSFAKKVRHISTTSKVSHPYKLIHDELGYNYRMPNLNAAVGCAQLETFEKIKKAKRELHYRYQNVLESCPWLNLVKEQDYANSNYWLNTVVLNKKETFFYENFLERCKENGIFIRPSWEPLHTLKMFCQFPSSGMENMNSLNERIFNLPSSPFL